MYANSYKNILYSKDCCTCLLPNENLNRTFVHFESKSEQSSIRKKLYLCCPELDLSVYSKITVCQNCLESINIIKQLIYQQSIKEGINEHKSLEITPSAGLQENLNTVKNEIKIEEIDLSDGDNNLHISRGTINNCFGIDVYNTVKLVKSSLCDYEFVDNKCITEQLVPHTQEELQQTVHYSHSANENDSIFQDYLHTERKLYKCFQCNYDSSSKTSLINHINNHTKVESFKYGQSKLIKCVQTVSKEKSFKCSQYTDCSSIKSILNTQKPHIYTEEKRFQCLQCSYCCRTKSALNRHTYIHAEKKRFQCSQCAYCCVRKYDLYLHMNTHTGEKPFKCSQCDYCASRQSALYVHSRIHTGEKPFKCPQCSYCFRTKSALNAHTLIHIGKKSFKCLQCSYICIRKFQLDLHMRTHSGEKPFKCSQCNHRCVRKYQLNRHMQTHTGEKLFECTQCNYCCMRKYDLSIHMRTHTAEKPFKCSQCTYRCIRKYDLNLHMRRHTGERPYKCYHCTYGCSQKSNLYKHMQIHSREKIFK